MALTPEEVGGVLCEFLEIFVHQVLHLRQIYSRDLFSKQRQYNIEVVKSRHPELNNYIHQSVISLKVIPVFQFARILNLACWCFF